MFTLFKRPKADPIEIGTRAGAILDSDAWKEAWDAYRERLHEMIENAPADDHAQVMHLKRLLATAHQCRHHLECLMRDGRLAQDQLLTDRNDNMRRARLRPVLRDF